MSQRNLRFAIVASTAGSVLNQVLGNAFFRKHVHSVVTDRHCPAAEKARAHGIHTELILENTNERFCQLLHDYLVAEQIDFVFTYYTNFYTQSLRDSFQDRIINFHPSLLPAFKGMDGFGDAVAYYPKYVGNTVEFIDQKMDEGKIIMQTACPLDTNVPLEVVRHRLFVQQCKCLLQVAKWLTEDRIVVDGRRVEVIGANFSDPAFAPGLDFKDARELAVPIPNGMTISAVTA
jgi:phosphoribosylglycinamide formyltransferase-1